MTFARAYLLREDESRIDFWFNPSTLRKARHAKYNDRGDAGRTAPTLEYLSTDPESLSLELLLHAQEDADGEEVQDAIESLERLIEPTVEVPSTKQRRPQQVRLVWGQYTSPVCVCRSVSTTIELFDTDGTPLRAIVALELAQAKAELGDQGQNPTTRATQRRLSHLVHTGDTLAGIAWAHYRDPTRWRAIARANGIDDPLRLPVGAHLTVPLERTP